MLKTLAASIVAGIAGLWIATNFVPLLKTDLPLQKLLIGGSVLGVVLAIVRPFVTLIVSAVLLFVGIVVAILLLR